MPPFTSARTQEAYSLAKQALDDGEQVFMLRVQWHAEGMFPGPVARLPEPAGIVQAVESVGWQLDRLDSHTDSMGGNVLVLLFRRDLR